MLTWWQTAFGGIDQETGIYRTLKPLIPFRSGSGGIGTYLILLRLGPSVLRP
jgi:hypothetical protein